jgi:hypothetical protein
MSPIIARAETFCQRFGLRLPILLAPMAGASSPSLSIAVANAGGLGSCGALLMQPQQIVAWANEVRASSNGAFQLNLWIPDPPPLRDAAHEARVRKFLADWRPPVAPEAGNETPPDFAAQCDALLAVGPPIVSSVMGLYPPPFITKLKERGISYFAHVTTLAEAREVETAGADVIVAQGRRRADIAAPSGPRKLSGVSSAFSHYFLPWSTPCACRSSPPAGLWMGAGWRLPSRSVPARRRSEPDFCAVRRPGFIRHGPTLWPTLPPRTQSSVAYLVADPGAALQPITSAPQWRPMRRRPLRTRFSAH